MVSGKKICIIIPSRWESSRFIGKPLAMIGDKTMIQRVYERCKMSNADEVIVATDDLRILDHVVEFGVCTLTPEFDNGTLRVCFVASVVGDEYDFYINVQGDEPFIDPDFLNRFMEELVLSEEKSVVTGAVEIKKSEMQERSVVKLISGDKNSVVSFTRSPFFSNTNYLFKHVGIYGFKNSDINFISKLKPSKLSELESLEQIRWMEEGFEIRYVICDKETLSIDLPSDLDKANDLISNED